jgi:hypothetical protein
MAYKTDYSTKTDIIGASASLLCAVHCLIAPFLFLTQASILVQHQNVPLWYQILDYVFLFISFFAILYSIRSTTKKWIKTTLWLTWVLLTIAILNETFTLIHLSELAVYIPAFGLIGLHIYNHKYCRCN